MHKAKIFWSGRSQAVRLPKEFRFEGTEVRIRRDGNSIVLEPMGDEWAWLDKMPGNLDEDFVEAALDRSGAGEDDTDPAVKDFFK